jgi:hypothetical protein
MSFDVNRLRRADWIVGGGAVALFVFMFFFKWFGASVSAPSLPGVSGASFSISSSINGWHSLTHTRWLLLITLLAALAAVALIGMARKVEPSPAVIVTGLGLLSAIFVFYRILDHPHGGGVSGLASFSYGAKAGLYLAFVAALAIVYGGYLEMQAEGTSLSDVREQASSAFSNVTSSAGGPSGGSGGGAPAGAGGSVPAAAPPTPAPAAPQTPPATPPPGSPPPASSPPASSAPAAPPIPPPATPPGSGAPGGMPPSPGA